MTADIRKLKAELTGYMYKHISNKQVAGRFMSMFFYPSNGKDVFEILSAASVETRYEVTKSNLTDKKLTVLQYAVTYNDFKILQLIMKDFTPKWVYEVLMQEITYSISGRSKGSPTLEYMTDILNNPSQFPSAVCETIEEIAVFLLNGISRSQKLELANNEKVLTGLVNSGSASPLKLIIEGASYHDRIEMLKFPNRNSRNVLETIIHEGKTKILEVFGAGSSQPLWFQMITQPWRERNPIELAIGSGSAEGMLKVMLSGLSADESFKALSIITSHASEYSQKLKRDLQLIRKVTKTQVLARLLATQSSSKNTPLHLVARAKKAKVIFKLLSDLSCDELLEVLKVEDHKGCTVLHIALATWSLDLDKMILSIAQKLKIEDKTFLMTNAWKDKALIHLAVHRGSVPVLNSLLDAIPSQHKLDIMKIQDDAGKTPLHLAATKRKSLELVTSLLSGLETEKHKLLSVQCNNEMTPLHYALHDQVVASYLLQDLLEDQLYSVVKIPDKNGNTIFHQSSSCSEDLKELFNRLSLKSQLKLLCFKNCDGITPLKSVFHNYLEQEHGRVRYKYQPRMEVKNNFSLGACTATTELTQFGNYVS